MSARSEGPLAERRLRSWMIVAAMAYLGASAAIRWRSSFPPGLPSALPLLSVLAATVCALLATRSYLLFLRTLDELLRRIEIEALAIGFGAGVIVALLYPLCEELGAPGIGGFAIAPTMLLSWALASGLGKRRFFGGAPGEPG